MFFCPCSQELDDTASFRNVPSKWGDDPEFPLPFGRTLTAAEDYVSSLDEGTGAKRLCVLVVRCWCVHHKRPTLHELPSPSL